MAENRLHLRKYPYPYRAMLAICSDLDETPDRHVYWEIMRFLNTNEMTSMGPGIGLEVGNTIYFDMPPGQFAYWNTDDTGREMIRTLIRSGHIDCLHSYGDLATTRRHAGRALDELARHDCRIRVWVDHGTAPTNFGSDIMQGHGDQPGHPAYHADLTCDYGIKYVWRGRVTSMIGQDAKPSLGGIFSSRHPVASARTVAKEAAKVMLGRRGSAKFVMHGHNALLRPGHLRNGWGVQEFIRCNPHWGGVSCADRGTRLGEVITPDLLDRIVAREATCILYTHLGKIGDHNRIFPETTCQALRLLADYHQAGKILVTTTSRLLQYRQMLKETVVELVQAGRDTRLDVKGIDHPASHGNNDRQNAVFEGLTILTDARPTSVCLNGRHAERVEQDRPDKTGYGSISIPWKSLPFPGGWA